MCPHSPLPPCRARCHLLISLGHSVQGWCSQRLGEVSCQYDAQDPGSIGWPVPGKALWAHEGPSHIFDSFKQTAASKSSGSNSMRYLHRRAFLKPELQKFQPSG